MNESWLLLGAPGVGKSTFSYKLKKKCCHLKQFSVRLHTEKVLEKGNDLARYLIENQCVQPQRHMPDFVVEQIFADFLSDIGESDFLLIEGYPINDEQFRGVLHQLEVYQRKIDGVLILEDSYDEIVKRIKNRRVCMFCEKKAGGGIPISVGINHCPICGGVLSKRPEDDIDFFKVRYEMYLAEKKNIYRWINHEVIHEITINLNEVELLCDEWKNRINKN